jgi:hypothetical protein
MSLSENFDHPQGRFTNYDAYEVEQLQTVLAQKHVDIRSFSFEPDSLSSNYPQEVFTPLNTVTDAIGPDPARRNWNTMRGDIAAGITATFTLSLSQYAVKNYSSHIPTIDLETGFDDDALITFASPDYNHTAINAANSFLQFSSHPLGSFTAGYIDTLSFDDSLTVLANGDMQFSWPRSMLTTVDLSAITNVRFVVQNTSGGTITFVAAALRMITPDHQYLPLETNTEYGRLYMPPAPNGDVTRAYDSDVPILWRSAVPSGTDDPRPIDVSLVAAFNTGSRDGTNRITLYTRENTFDWWDQNDLDGMTMAELNALGHQPDFGGARYEERTMDELDAFTMDELEGDLMYDLERTPDDEAASHIAFQLVWTPTDESILVTDVEGNNFSESGLGILAANSRYLLIIDVIDREGRLRIQEVGDYEVPGEIVYDTGFIVDDFLFKRISGRIGWQASFQDGDAYLSSIAPRFTNYAEYRSGSFGSITPVEGAQLFVEESGAEQLFTGFTTTQFGVTLLEDTARTTSGESIRVTLDGSDVEQGILTNLIEFDDFANTELSFDLYHTGIERGGLRAALVWGNYNEIPLQLGYAFPNQWQTVRVNLAAAHDAPPGPYHVMLYLDDGGDPVTFWIDKFSIQRASIEWAARAVEQDPWEDHSAEWVKFGNVVNDREDGVLFPERGHTLQVRGRALVQDAYINRIRILPKYAELGRFVWPEEYDVTAAPTAGMGAITSVSGRTYAYDGTSSVANAGGASIINYHWYFGDGNEGDGAKTQHTYSGPGSYRVTLIVTDTYGQSDAVEGTINVS